MKKKVVAMVLGAAMVMSMAACGGGKTADTTTAAAADAGAGTTAAVSGAVNTDDLPEVTLTLGSSAASSNDTYQVMVDLEKEVEEKTGGKLKINVVWDGTLGGDGELVESCMGGSVDMVSLASSPLLAYFPEIAVFDMPMVFDSTDQAAKGLSAFTESFQPIMREKNIELLSLGFQQFRGLSTNVEIKTPEDIKGMSIRIMENKYHQLFWQNLGANPTPMAFSELYLSLQQGLVDAQDNPIGGIYASKFYEVQDYIMRITAFPFVSFIIINEDVYNGLPEEYQKVLVEFAEDYNAKSLEVTLATEDGYVDLMEKKGLTCLEFTPEIRDAMKAAAEPVWEQIKQDIGSEIPDALLAAAEAAK